VVAVQADQVVQGAEVPHGPEVQPDQVLAGQAPVPHQLVHGPLVQAPLPHGPHPFPGPPPPNGPHPEPGDQPDAPPPGPHGPPAGHALVVQPDGQAEPPLVALHVASALAVTVSPTLAQSCATAWSTPPPATASSSLKPLAAVAVALAQLRSLEVRRSVSLLLRVPPSVSLVVPFSCKHVQHINIWEA